MGKLFAPRSLVKALSLLLFCGFLPVALQAQSMQAYADLQRHLERVHAGLQNPDFILDNWGGHEATINRQVGSDLDRNDNPRGELSLVDFRSVVLQMSQSFGGDFRPTEILEAQKSNTPMAIVIKNGDVDYGMLKEWVASQPAPQSIFSDDTLRLPLLVTASGHLTIRDNEVVKLSREDGVFLANFGTLVIEHAHVLSTTKINDAVVSFRPFIVTLGTGRANISRAFLEGLGFGKRPEFAGISIINRGLYDVQGPSFLIDSILKNVTQVMLGSSENMIVSGNQFVGSQSGGLALQHAKDTHIEDNTFADSRFRSAVRVSDGSTGTRVVNNIVMRSRSNGISISERSDNTLIMGNMVWGSDGSGISVRASNCVHIVGNTAIDNRRKGIEVRSGRGVDIVQNQLLGNKSAGLFIGSQASGSTTDVQQNAFVGNRIGVSSASAEEIKLIGNNFSLQFPRFLDGDLAEQGSKIVRDLAGRNDIVLNGRGVKPAPTVPVTCLVGLEG